MKTTITILAIILLISCGPSYHLKRMKYHERMAIAKGADIKPDTITKIIPVITPEHHFDTLYHYTTLTDTIVVTKDRIVTKVKVNTETKTVYVDTKCPSDTIYKQVPVTITKTISAKEGLPWWVYAVFGVCALVIVVLCFKR